MGKRMGMSLLIFIIAAAQFGFMGTTRNTAKAADKSLAQKPYMGWSSFSMQVYEPSGNWTSAESLKKQSDAMHEKLQAHGYNYINIDAGWNGGMDEYGRPIPSTTLYPNGFQEVIDYVHNNGQKIGIYLIPGLSITGYNENYEIYGTGGLCHMQDIAAQPLQIVDAWNAYSYKIDFTNPCAQQYIDSVADLLGEWGIDFVKFDSVTPGSGINDLSRDSRADVEAWSKALARHDIWFELSWALDHNYVDFWKKHANGWRIHWDVESYNSNVGLTEWTNIARLFPAAAIWWRDAGPGGWNDFDSLNVGNGSMDGLTKDERQTAMTFWAISAAPLYAGNDLTRLDSYGLELLTNDEVIAVNQAGRPAHPVSIDTQQQVWYANNGDGTFNVALFNLGSRSAEVEVKWSDIGLEGPASVRDLWSHTELGTFEEGISGGVLEPHASRMFKVTAEQGTSAVNDDDTGIRYNGFWVRNGGREQTAGQQELGITIGDSSAAAPAGNLQPADSEPADGSPESGLSSGEMSVTRSVYINDSDSSIVYSGSWAENTGRPFGDYKGDVHFTEKNGDYFQYTFTGTGVDLLTEKDSSQGDMLVYLDGGSPETVSAHTSGPREAQQPLYSVSGLANGEHTLKVVKDSGDYMLLDALKVTADTLIEPDQGVFDKEIGKQADVVTTLVLGNGSLVEVRNGGVPLAKGVDYLVDGNNVIIKKGYLFSQPAGKAELTLAFDGGSTQQLTIQIGSSSAQNSTIDPATADFDKLAALQKDVKTVLNLNGNTLSAIENNGVPLTEEDYAVDNGELTIKKEYLAKQPAGKASLTLIFSAGDPQLFVIRISDSATVRYSMINNDDPGIRYNGSWSRSTGRGMGDYKDDVQFTEKNGDSFEYTFRGTGIQLITEVDESQGDMDIYIDDKFQRTVSAHRNGRLAQQNLYSIAGLPEGLHTLKAVKKSGDFMLLDLLKVEIPDLIHPAEAHFDKSVSAQADIEVTLLANPEIFEGITNGAYTLVPDTDYTFAGNRVTLKKSYLAAQPAGTLNLMFTFGGDYHNDIHSTEANGDSLEYTFHGTGISLISPKGPEQGEVDVYVDGVLVQTVNAYSGSRQILQNLFSISGLADGSHTFKAVKKSGAVMLADQLKFTIAGSGGVSPEPTASPSPEPSMAPSPTPPPAAPGFWSPVTTPAATLAPSPASTPIAEDRTSEEGEDAQVTRHSAYIKGYPGGLFKPDNKITRAEIAVILVSAVSMEAGGAPAVFSDVGAKHWGAGAINAVAGMGLMKGYNDGTFRPAQTLTRAEMASVLAKLSPDISPAGNGFGDTTGHWAEEAIAKAQGAGILNGYKDGTFRPAKLLTRAEAVTAVNRAMGRGPLYGDLPLQWKDVPASHWAFGDIAEASVDHNSRPGPEGGEQWVE
ncbi:X2-like carbohydrate binding domain-containing protein [Paenibacillus albidus]|nr:X2-like carbohydrate binding domain-containing protein [Paenibacillus albidus]